MVAAYVSNLERLVSKPRLERYRPQDRDDLETAVNYLWNVALSEALLQGIAALEIAIRNAIHNALAQHIGTEDWFQAVLRPSEMKMVDDVWRLFSRRHQHPPTPGKVIAELTFGFWPTLFTPDYHDLWWASKASLFKTVFPFVPTGLPPRQAITRKVIHDRLDLCKNLRNRVMHHEPIFQGIVQLNKPIAPLPLVHEHIVDLLDWADACPATTHGPPLVVTSLDSGSTTASSGRRRAGTARGACPDRGGRSPRHRPRQRLTQTR